MIERFFKNPRVLFVAKIGLLLVFVYYLSGRLTLLSFEKIESHYRSAVTHPHFTAFILFFLLLFVVNWLSDTWIWRTIIKGKINLSFVESFKINLVSHAIGVVTPANVGEYGVRAMAFSETGKSRQSFLLTFAYRITKTFVKFGFGMVAGILLFSGEHIHPLYFYSTLGLLVIGFSFLPKFIDFLYHSKLGRWFFGSEEQRDWHFKNRHFWKALFPAMIKFASYSGQLALIIHLGSSTSLMDSFMGSVLTYSIASIIPTLSLFDPLVKTSIGDLVFQNQGLSIEWLAFGTTFVWLINLGIPSLFGFYLWLKKKTQTSMET